MIRRPPRSTLFPTRRSSDLGPALEVIPPGRVHGVERRLQERLQPVVEEIVGPRHREEPAEPEPGARDDADRKSTRLNSSHSQISYAVFCLKKKKKKKKKTNN